MSPTIYGIGSGQFNKLSIQIPTLLRVALKRGQAIVVGPGDGIWDYVHIDDLAKLYALVLQKILDGEQVPGGEQIMFTSTGRFAWRDASKMSADALHKLGSIKTADVKSLELQEAADILAGGNPLLAELAYASNSKTSADLAHELGWKPVKTERDFQDNFLEEAKLIIQEEH